MTYRDRRLARAERLRGWSETNENKSDAKRDAADRISDGIPFGQPILVGHHSEKRHRRDLAKIESGMRAAIELGDKAKSQAQKADNIEAATEGSIYDDDPDAIERLTEKLAALEAKREHMKTVNAEYRRAHRVELKAMSAYDRSQTIPFPQYSLTNLGGNIGRCRERLARLQRQQVTGPRDRIIESRYAGECADCGAKIERGQLIRYNRQQGARCNPKCPD
jgi:Domain of unknown function (DUF3560)